MSTALRIAGQNASSVETMAGHPHIHTSLLHHAEDFPIEVGLFIEVSSNRDEYRVDVSSKRYQ